MQAQGTAAQGRIQPDQRAQGRLEPRDTKGLAQQKASFPRRSPWSKAARIAGRLKSYSVASATLALAG